MSRALNQERALRSLRPLKLHWACSVDGPAEIQEEDAVKMAVSPWQIKVGESAGSDLIKSSALPLKDWLRYLEPQSFHLLYKLGWQSCVSTVPSTSKILWVLGKENGGIFKNERISQFRSNVGPTGFSVLRESIHIKRNKLLQSSVYNYELILRDNWKLYLDIRQNAAWTRNQMTWLRNLDPIPLVVHLPASHWTSPSILIPFCLLLRVLVFIKYNHESEHIL